MAEPEDLDQFSQSMHSLLDLDEQKEVLVKEARNILTEHPGADPVGLLFQAEAPLARGLAAAMEKATGENFHGRGFVGVMPRQLAVQILQSEKPELLEALGKVPGGEGLRRKLPMIAVTKDGARMLVVEYEAPEEWKGEMG